MENVDLSLQLKDLKKLLKQKPKPAVDIEIARMLVQLTTSQRHELERLYDDSNKKPLRSLFEDKKRKGSKPGFKGRGTLCGTSWIT